MLAPIKHTPPAPTMKARRQSYILEIVEREPARNQEQLRRRMRTAGFDVTQATLSRDIRELALVKAALDAAYQATPDTAPNGDAARSLLQRAAPDYGVFSRGDQ